ncbi:MAG: hypothetical protein ACHQ3P_04080 [Candidatus Limnocylindrales bacterium]
MHFPQHPRVRNFFFALITAGSLLMISALTVLADSGAGPYPR